MGSGVLMLRGLLLAALVLGQSTHLYAQAPPQADPVDLVLRRLERALTTGDRSAVPPLFAASVTEKQVQQNADELFTAGAVRTAVFERNRAPLEGVPEGDGYSLVVEFFSETPGRARILTAGVDVQRPHDGAIDTWRISNIDSVSSVEGLYKLRLNTASPLTTRNLELRSEDVVVALQDGFVFPVECDDGVTGVVLVGRGELRFSPAAATERGQMRLFAGSESLATPFETAYVRFNPHEYQRQIATATLTPATADGRTMRRAQDVFRRGSPLSFSVDLQDMSRDPWHLLPPGDDFLAEIDTRKYDTLTYSRSNLQAEDVSLFRRSDRHTFALYPSVAKLAARGRFYTDDSAREYDVLDYNVDAFIDPRREYIQGRTRMSMRIRSTAVTAVLVRLADTLTVTGVTSVEYGRLLHLRLHDQNMILVNLPRPLLQDSDLTLVVSYAGRIESQNLDIDTVQAQAPDPSSPGPVPALEPKYLLSNRSVWYPQNPIPDYATATIRIRVPDEYRCVASGEPMPESSVVSLQDIASNQSGRVFSFRANQPLRYLALVISKLIKVGESRIEFSEDTAGAGGDPIAISMETNPHQQARGRALMRPVEDILRFYTTLVGDAPYASATIALTESELPGGHSPGYFSLINEPPQPTVVSWRGDPAAFEGFPDFFVAHELAHQWWGQAIGTKNYHEQWLSEGFSQYFAALYAQKTRGERVFTDMLKQFRRWSLEESDQGPVYLGTRLGHIKSDPRVYRALVYNKGAAVLHMLRRLIGDQAFFSGVRLFYEDRRYQKAGTDDFERAMEMASGRILDRFFERWIYNGDIPKITYRSTIGTGRVTVRFEQTGNGIFDIPVTVTVVYGNGRTADVVVPVADREVERTIATDGPVREVQVNRDFAALAEFDGK